MGKAHKTLTEVYRKMEETRKEKVFAHQIIQKQLGDIRLCYQIFIIREITIEEQKLPSEMATRCARHSINTVHRQISQ